MRKMSLLGTRLGRVGILPFLVALVVQAGMPLLSAHHSACNVSRCATTVHGGPSPDELASSDPEGGIPPAEHDPLTCRVCHLISAARSLRISIHDTGSGLAVPREHLSEATPIASLVRMVRTAFRVRAPPLSPRLSLV